MADNVLFCWRTRLKKAIEYRNPSEERAPSGDFTRPPGRQDGATRTTKSCMLIYLDRIGDESHRLRQRLFKLPVNGNGLVIGEQTQAAQAVDESEYLDDLDQSDMDKITLITNKQGFESGRMT